jgi:hypothetical protein
MREGRRLPPAAPEEKDLNNVKDSSKFDGMSSARADLRAVLVELDELEYEHQRKEIAKQFGIGRVSVLDKLYEEEQRSRTEDGPRLQGIPIHELIRDVEPSGAPVSGAELLEAIVSESGRYLRLPKSGPETLAVYALYTHLFDLFGRAPYLNFRSPAPECGKTTALTFVEMLCPRVLPADSISVAGIFRALTLHAQVILSIDEVDGWLEYTGQDARSILNTGFQKGRYVIRTVGDDHEPRGFDCFGPKLLSGIGALPGTVESRSIVIPMERVTAREARDSGLKTLERGDDPPALLELARQAARWARDNRAKVVALDVASELTRRERDKWRPLFAVAEIAGGDWPGRIRKAVRDLRQEVEPDTEALELLRDVAGYFAGLGWPSFLPTARILGHLTNSDNGPGWLNYGPDKLTAKRLGGRLGTFPAVKSKHSPDKTERGYYAEPVRAAFDRYLSADPPDPKRPCVQRPEDTQDSRAAMCPPSGGPLALPAAKESIDSGELDTWTRQEEGAGYDYDDNTLGESDHPQPMDGLDWTDTPGEAARSSDADEDFS